MATFNATALKGHTLHTPRGFLIFNEGRETRFIPEEHRAKLEAEGVIAPKASAASAPAGKGGKAGKGAAPKASADFDPAPFIVAQGPGIGVYAITGPGLDAPVSVKGKAQMQARVAEMQADLAPPND